MPECPWNKVSNTPQFSGLSLDEALALVDAPRDPVFGLQFAQISATYLPTERSDVYVSFQCGIDPLRSLSIIYRHGPLKLSEITGLAQRILPEVDTDTVATWMQEFRDARLIKGSPADGFSLYMAAFCSYTFQPDNEQSDSSQLSRQ